MKFLALAFRHTHTHRICILLMDNTQVWEIYCNPIFSDYMPHILRKKKKKSKLSTASCRKLYKRLSNEGSKTRVITVQREMQQNRDFTKMCISSLHKEQIKSNLSSLHTHSQAACYPSHSSKSLLMQTTSIPLQAS